MALVLTSHIPCLFLPALHSQPHGLHAVSLVQPVDGSHQGGALAAVGDRVKEVGLYWRVITYAT